MNNWRWNNPSASGHQVDHTNPQTTSLRKITLPGEFFSWYGSDDLQAKIEPPSCQQYNRGDLLAVRLLNWDEKINGDNDDENRADPAALRGG
jgi:hypothetical protein